MVAQELISDYYDLERSRLAVEKGEHRRIVGGLWREIGKLTSRLLIDRGLQRDQMLLDVGCGCLRVGVHLVAYLDPGHYYGTDISADLLDVGYEVELAERNLQNKLPREHLLADGTFEFERLPTTRSFDVVLAQSVFTHLPGNHIRLCLHQLVAVTHPSSRFYATVFLCPDSHDWTKPILHQPGGTMSYPAQDCYHYTADDLHSFVRDLPWRIESIEAWNHPRNQTMVTFVREET